MRNHPETKITSLGDTFLVVWWFVSLHFLPRGFLVCLKMTVFEIGLNPYPSALILFLGNFSITSPTKRLEQLTSGRRKHSNTHDPR